ncbi:flavodoxin domain-containing protein [Salinigranum sp. GCM10025319]|uniref:flavodoxin domain-containing protein n=1 Tax=Salinigranum sp. GCM10025319 TaxID=3252687 RepID=UPI003615109D
MTRVALVYGTTEGQTATIAERIAAVLGDAGHDPTLVHADHLPAGFDVNEYDAVIVGASIHYGRHQSSVARFVRDHVDALGGMPSAFFSVSLTAADESDEARATARSLLEGFLAETGWEPDATLVVAGALKYSEYGLLTRFVMKRIARKHGEITDTSRDYEYTDWDDVERFATEFAVGLD